MQWNVKLLHPTGQPQLSWGPYVEHIQLFLNKNNSTLYLSRAEKEANGKIRRNIQWAYSDLDSAKLEFKRLIKEACGLSWTDLQSPVTRRRLLLMLPEDEDTLKAKVYGSLSTETTQTLPSGVHDVLLRLMKSRGAPSKTYPVTNRSTRGKESRRETVLLGLFLLDRLKDLVALPRKSRADEQLMLDACNCYYSLLGGMRPSTPPVVDIEWVLRQQGILTSRYPSECVDGLLTQSLEFRNETQLHQFYQSLGLKEMTLCTRNFPTRSEILIPYTNNPTTVSETSQEYRLLAKYFTETQKSSYYSISV